MSSSFTALHNRERSKNNLRLDACFEKGGLLISLDSKVLVSGGFFFLLETTHFCCHHESDAFILEQCIAFILFIVVLYSNCQLFLIN